MRERDEKFLSSISDHRYRLIYWYATHGPKPRLISEIPDDEIAHGYWQKTSWFDESRKIFPPHKLHSWAAGKFGIAPDPKFSKGIPGSISSELLSFKVPHSTISVYTILFRSSYYHPAWKMRVCEVSYGLLAKESKLSKRTICRALTYLRDHWFVRIIWRGRPEPEDPRYLHSCYELPANHDHIVSWRINKGRPKDALRKN